MRLATRPSALALAQAELVSRELGGCELVAVSTGGDRGAPAQDKSRWVDEIERALLDGRADLAVHSAKDLPGELAEGLELVGAPARGAPEDVLCGAGGIEQLGPGARVGTSSVRRVAQLRAARKDLEVAELHGNVDTRLARLQDPELGLACDRAGAGRAAAPGARGQRRREPRPGPLRARAGAGNAGAGGEGRGRAGA